MRCCPMCYSKAYLRNTSVITRGTTMEIKYRISCCNCGLGPEKSGSVLMTYIKDDMQSLVDDSELKNLIEEWDSILRDPEKEKGN